MAGSRQTHSGTVSCILGLQGTLDLKVRGFFVCLFFKLKRKKEKGKRSNQTYDTGTLNMAPIFKLCFGDVYFH